MSMSAKEVVNELAKESDYSWEFFVDRYNEVVEDEERDWDYLLSLTTGHDW